MTGSSLFYGGKKVSYCPTAIAWCKKNMTKVASKNAKPGDIVFFDWDGNGNPDHIGMVYENHPSGRWMKTIEGNQNDKVSKVNRSYYLTKWVFRPKWTSEWTAAEFVKYVKSQVGIKEKNHDNNVKYNTEYYGKTVKGQCYAWCCVFIWYCFKHMKKVEKKVIAPKVPAKKTTTTKKTTTAKKTPAKKTVNVSKYPTIKKGSKGTYVKKLQTKLGFTGKAVDGVFGAKTEAKVKAYQKKHKLKADGIVGQATWKTLYK